eukprot:scaffold18085_cov141-Isochrysis_galbana.AAC.3
MSVYFHRIVRSDPIARGTSSRGAKNRISTAATSCAPPLLRGEHILVGVALSRHQPSKIGGDQAVTMQVRLNHKMWPSEQPPQHKRHSRVASGRTFGARLRLA